MKIAIIYSTKHGFTEKCSKLLSEGLSCESDILNIKNEKNINISEYQLVVLGSSVYAGRINKNLSDFINRNKDILNEKSICLFTCNMHKGQEALEQIEKVFPEFLVEKSIYKASFGGNFDFSKMNFLEKNIIKKIAKTDKSVENIELNNIKEMQDAINKKCLEV